ELAALQLRHRLRGTGDRLELDIEALGLEQAAPYRDLQGRGVRDRHRADGELRLLQVGAGRLRVVAAPRDRHQGADQDADDEACKSHEASRATRRAIQQDLNRGNGWIVAYELG